MKKFILIILLIFLTHLHVKAMESTSKGVYALSKDFRVQDSSRKENEESYVNSLINNQQSSQLKMCFETINSYEKFLLKPENIWNTVSLLNDMLCKVSNSLNVLMNVQEKAILLDFTKNMLEKNGYLAFASIKNTFDIIMNSQLIQKSETNEREVNPGCSQSSGSVDGLEHSSLIDLGCDSVAIEMHEHFLNAMDHDDEQKRLQYIEKILMKIDSAYDLLSKDISSINKNFILDGMIDDMYELTNFLYQFNHYKYSSTILIDKMAEEYKNDGYLVLFPSLQQKLNRLIKLRNFYTPDAVAKPNKVSEFYADQSSCNLLTAQSNKEKSLGSQLHTFIDSNPVHLNCVCSHHQQEVPLPKAEKEDHEMNTSVTLSEFARQNKSNSFCVCKKFKGKHYSGLVAHCYNSHSQKINDDNCYICPSNQCKNATYERRTFIVHLIEVHKLFNIKGTKLVNFISANGAFASIKKAELEKKNRRRAKSISQGTVKKKRARKVKKTELRENEMIISDEVQVKAEISINKQASYDCDTHIENSNDFWNCFDQFFKVEIDEQIPSEI